jgi:serine/threonine protein kinase/Flp pilus assembly protein TadD
MKSSLAPFPESRGYQQARSIAQHLIEGWRTRSNPSAARALQRYPLLFHYRSIAMDLAYEEYCLRSESGEQLDTGTFCQQFPDFLASLQQRIAMHMLLEDRSSVRSPPPAPRWPQPGERIMGYRVQEKIGQGSFARVYTATEEEIGSRLVVIKVCPHGAQEADTLGRIEHPSIVPIHSVKQDVAGLTVICMPMLGTSTLARIIQQESTSEDQRDRRDNHRHCHRIVQLMLPIARALDHAHGLGVLHLDLKPSNILVTDDQRPMLLDFNLSWDSNHNSHHAGGTLPYMSPEQIGQLIMNPGTELDLDPRSDVFSFGVILFELAHGRLPWKVKATGNSMRDVASSLLGQQQAFVQFDSPSTPADLQAIIRSCLAWSPGDRFQQMSEVAEALERFSRFTRRLAESIDVHRRLVLGVAMTLGTASFLGGLKLATHPASGKTLIVQGETAMNHGRYATAVTLFTHAMEHPESALEAQYRRGLALASAEDFNWAIDDFLAVRKATLDPRFDALIGYSYQSLQRYEEALDWYRSAIRSGCTGWQLWVNMGHVAMNQNGHLDARRYLDRAEKAGGTGAAFFYARLLNESWQQGPQSQSSRQLAHWAHQLAACQFTGPAAHTDLARALARLGSRNLAELPLAARSLEVAILQGADLQRLSRDPQLQVLFQQFPRLFHVKTSGHHSHTSFAEPIPVLYTSVQIEPEKLKPERRPVTE